MTDSETTNRESGLGKQKTENINQGRIWSDEQGRSENPNPNSNQHSNDERGKWDRSPKEKCESMMADSHIGFIQWLSVSLESYSSLYSRKKNTYLFFLILKKENTSRVF